MYTTDTDHQLLENCNTSNSLHPPKNHPPNPIAFVYRLGKILSLATLAKYLSACVRDLGSESVEGSGPVYTLSG